MAIAAVTPTEELKFDVYYRSIRILPTIELLATTTTISTWVFQQEYHPQKSVFHCLASYLSAPNRKRLLLEDNDILLLKIVLQLWKWLQILQQQVLVQCELKKNIPKFVCIIMQFGHKLRQIFKTCHIKMQYKLGKFFKREEFFYFHLLSNIRFS